MEEESPGELGMKTTKRRRYREAGGSEHVYIVFQGLILSGQFRGRFYGRNFGISCSGKKIFSNFSVRDCGIRPSVVYILVEDF